VFAKFISSFHAKGKGSAAPSPVRTTLCKRDVRVFRLNPAAVNAIKAEGLEKLNRARRVMQIQKPVKFFV
jgi:hypothetical protein